MFSVDLPELACIGFDAILFGQYCSNLGPPLHAQHWLDPLTRPHTPGMGWGHLYVSLLVIFRGETSN